MSGAKRPTYARMLRLRRLNPPSWLCFLLLEGSVLIGLLLALSELVGWEFGAALPFAVAAVVKLIDMVRVSREGSAATVAAPASMRTSVAVVRAQQRAGGAARPVSTPVTHAPSLAARERNRRVVRGVAAVPGSARLRPRLSRGTTARVVGAWPMPIASMVDSVVDAVRDAGWRGPTVSLSTDPVAARDGGPGGDVAKNGAAAKDGAAANDGAVAKDGAAAQVRDRRRARNQGRFVRRR